MQDSEGLLLRLPVVQIVYSGRWAASQIRLAIAVTPKYALTAASQSPRIDAGEDLIGYGCQSLEEDVFDESRNREDGEEQTSQPTKLMPHIIPPSMIISRMTLAFSFLPFVMWAGFAIG